MATGQNRLLDELAKLMTDAAAATQGVRREVETVFKTQGERILGKMDLVNREEFEAARDMAAKARAENARLLTRIQALEAKLGLTEPTIEDAPAKATASRVSGSAAKAAAGASKAVKHESSPKKPAAEKN